MEQNKDRNKEKFDVDVDGILRMQYNRDLKRKRDKINAKKKEALEEQARKKARKKIIRTGIFVLAFGASLGLNAKNVIEKQNQKNAINKAFEPIEEEAQSIISNNDNINADGTIKLGDGEFVYQYYHGSIASDLKEHFAQATRSSASLNEVKDVKNKEGQVIKINQYELSEVVISRIDEILSLANQELNKLTSHKPEIIFVTGGITNMINFSQICREKLGKCAIIGSVNLIGLRNNKFSSAIGNIIYFINKLKLKGKDYSMVNNDEIEILSTPRKNTNDSMLGKVFGYFFGE